MQQDSRNVGSERRWFVVVEAAAAPGVNHERRRTVAAGTDVATTPRQGRWLMAMMSRRPCVVAADRCPRVRGVPGGGGADCSTSSGPAGGGKRMASWQGIVSLLLVVACIAQV